MFLFKLTLPVLGTATLGAVGTGIYCAVKNGEAGSQSSKETSQSKVQSKEISTSSDDSQTTNKTKKNLEEKPQSELPLEVSWGI